MKIHIVRKYKRGKLGERRIVDDIGEMVAAFFSADKALDWSRSHNDADTHQYLIDSVDLLDYDDWFNGVYSDLQKMHGTKGGAAKTEAKQKASVDNGKKGGRPKRITGRIVLGDREYDLRTTILWRTLRRWVGSNH